MTGIKGALAREALGVALVFWPSAAAGYGGNRRFKWGGQSVALARRPQPAAEIVAELVSRL